MKIRSTLTLILFLTFIVGYGQNGTPRHEQLGLTPEAYELVIRPLIEEGKSEEEAFYFLKRQFSTIKFAPAVPKSNHQKKAEVNVIDLDIELFKKNKVLFVLYQDPCIKYSNDEICKSLYGHLGVLASKYEKHIKQLDKIFNGYNGQYKIISGFDYNSGKYDASKYRFVIKPNGEGKEHYVTPKMRTTPTGGTYMTNGRTVYFSLWELIDNEIGTESLLKIKGLGGDYSAIIKDIVGRLNIMLRK